jgi:hypothetical protein
MDWKDIGNTVAKFAPMIASGLGSPLAGTAIAALEGVFGIQTGETTKDKQDALVAALSGATPDQLLALKKAEQDYAAKMAELGFKNVADLEQIAANDRDSARKREDTVKDWTPRILAYMIVTAFVGVIVGVLAGWGKVDTVLAGTLVGYLSAKAEQVVAYYFGSSVGSKDKTDLLAKAQPIVH